MDTGYGTAKLNLLKSVLVGTGIGGFNASDVRAGTITNVFENILILLSKCNHRCFLLIIASGG